MKKIVIASNNLHKIKEIKDMLSPLGYDVLSLSDISFNEEIVEDGLTFIDNALIKAKRIREVTGYPVLADDSGLSVDLLNGEPGVHSHRYASVTNASDKANRDKLISVLKEINNPPYNAHFTCAMVYMDDDKIITKEGYVYGEIILEERGNNGFGYDPIFYLKDYNKTMGELDEEMKNLLSHRHNALVQIIEELK